MNDYDRSRYLSKLYANPKLASERRELIQRLDRANHGTEIGVEMVIVLVEALQEAAHVALPNPPPRRNIDELRKKLRSQLRSAAVRSMLYTYRNASNEELETFIRFWESSDGKRIADQSRSSIAAGFDFGKDIALQTISTNLGK